MRSARGVWRAGPLVRSVLAALVLAAGPVQAQDGQSLILTLDPERFFQESAFGRAAAEREQLASTALQDENRRIEADLVAEEQELTDLRKTLAPEEFSARAEAFDAKVERIRTEQDDKARALVAARETERDEFRRIARPILGELLSERQAVAILDKNTVIVSLPVIDVTDAAIAKVNAALAEPDPPEPAQPAP